MRPCAVPVDLDRQAELSLLNKYCGAALRSRPFLSKGFLRRNKHKLKNRYKPLALLLSLLLVASTASGRLQSAAPASTRPITPAEQKLVDNLSIATIKETVNALAADEMQGRGTA